MNTLLNIWVPYLPPSSNRIYIRHPTGKGRILSSEARTFQIRAMQEIQKHGRLVFMHLKHNIPYELRLAIFLEKVENATSEAGNRFKKVDLSNRVKLIEDVVAKAIGLGDEHNFKMILEKHCDPDHPGLYVELGTIPEDEVGLTKESYDKLRLRSTERQRTDQALPQARVFNRKPWDRS